MPYVRYAVPEEYLVNGYPVDWGTYVGNDPWRDLQIYEVWCDSEAQARSLANSFQVYGTSTTGSWTVRQWQEDVWRSWTASTTTSATVTMRVPVQREDRHLLDRRNEQERQRRQQDALQRQEERLRRSAEANDRAHELLKMVLTPAEYDFYSEHGVIMIRGSDQKIYQLKTEHFDGNVEQLDDDGVNIMLRVCAHPHSYDYDAGGNIPRDDLLAGQVLALKNDAEGFLEKANVHWRRDPDRAPLLGDPSLRPRLPWAIAA